MGRTCRGLALVVATLVSIVATPVGPSMAATATLAIVSPLVSPLAAAPVVGSGVGEWTARATFVDIQVPPGPVPDSSTSGCEAADFAGFPAGNIAVIQRGSCTFAQKVANAEAAGAVAVVLFNEGQPGRTDVTPFTLGAFVASIPVVATGFAQFEEMFNFEAVDLRVAATATASSSICASQPPSGTPLGGRNVVVAQPGTVTFGTGGDDVIYGTDGPDRIAGLGGNDVIFGSGGDDRLSGGAGDDTLCGGAGTDQLSGGADDDALDGAEGDDELAGGAGDDVLVGGPGVNRLAGGDGSDLCSPFGAQASQVATCESVPPPV